MSIDINQLATYYANLLIIQYISKTKAWMDMYFETKGLWLDDLFSQIRDCFNKDTAVGVQLDTIAKYVGVTRMISGQVGVLLSDDDLRTFINFKIIQNNSNNSNYEIDFLISSFFGNDIKVIDNMDMTMTYIFPQSKSTLLTNLIAENALPKPAGVGINTVLMPDLVFGFGGYTEGNAPYIFGFDDYNLAPSGAIMLGY